LVIWGESTHCVTHLSAARALKLLGELNSDAGWQEAGLTIGEPANIIHLDPGQVQELFDLLQRNQAVLQQMADEIEKRRRQALARAYAEILSWPDPREKGKKGEGNLS
jgi:hypothetical protein